MSRIPALVAVLSLSLAAAACAHPRQRPRPVRLTVQAHELAEQAERLHRLASERRGPCGREWHRLVARLRSFETAARRLERALDRHGPRHRSVERALERLGREWDRLEQSADRLRRIPPRLARGLDRLAWHVARLHAACERPWRRPGGRCSSYRPEPADAGVVTHSAWASEPVGERMGARMRGVDL